MKKILSSKNLEIDKVGPCVTECITKNIPGKKYGAKGYGFAGGAGGLQTGDL